MATRDDGALAAAAVLISESRTGQKSAPIVRSFFDEQTNTVTHVVHDPATRAAAIIDSVRDFDPASGRIGHTSADRLIECVQDQGLNVEWQLETHVHADHLSAAPYLKQRLGGRIAIGREIVAVQATFGRILNENDGFPRDGSQFDRLFCDGDTFAVGSIAAMALHVPGHTPADVAYVIGDAVFAGDTLFMPDYGTARADFPGGDARQLYRSIRRLQGLPREARVFLCHDYKAPGRNDFAWETTIGQQHDANVHMNGSVSEAEFVEMRRHRDAALDVPRLLWPSIQVNMRAGHLPPPESNGVSYLKIPVDWA